MQAKPRDIHLLKCFGLIKHQQDALDAITHIGADPAAIPSFVELLQAAMPDACDHA
jgi:hypothetical protein